MFTILGVCYSDDGATASFMVDKRPDSLEKAAGLLNEWLHGEGCVPLEWDEIFIIDGEVVDGGVFDSESGSYK